MKLLKAMKRFSKDESGAAIVEYGIALLVVGALGVGVFQTIGDATSDSVDAACGVVVDGTAYTC